MKSELHCVPIKTSTFYCINNSVKNRVIWIIFGTQNPEEILHKWYVASPPQLKDVTTIYLVKGRPYASDQIFIDSFNRQTLFFLLASSLGNVVTSSSRSAQSLKPLDAHTCSAVSSLWQRHTGGATTGSQTKYSNKERKCADTTGTVLLPWTAGHFPC